MGFGFRGRVPRSDSEFALAAPARNPLDHTVWTPVGYITTHKSALLSCHHTIKIVYAARSWLDFEFESGSDFERNQVQVRVRALL